MRIVTLTLALLASGACSGPSAPPGGADACVAAVCAATPRSCGSVSDGCGGTLDCGECPAGEVCGSAAANRCAPIGCAPKTCAELGFDCGTADDGCGRSIECGPCTLPATCGGSGAPNRCGCQGESEAALCLAAGKNCGDLSVQDRCGVARSLHCGDCTNGLVCGGGGVANVCGTGSCVARSCAEQGKDCGSVDDGCGHLLPCGTCTAPETCGGGGVANVCGVGSCVPATCGELNRDCGTVDDSCGTPMFCGTCQPPETCGGAGMPNQCGVGTCTPLTCTDLGAKCGTPDDGCGTLIPCGECLAPKTCGGGGWAYHCGCTPLTCAGIPAGTCGAISDGCGGTLQCECPAPEACGANGTCGCTPKTCAELGCGEAYDGCGRMVDCGACPSGSSPAPIPLRVTAANTTSGNMQSYDPGEGIRIFQALKPDVAMLQEFNFGSNDKYDLRRMVVTAFGPGFFHWRETGRAIPNGVVSRYPIVESGSWSDPQVSDRAFAWAHIDLPGPRDLWAVSLHFKTGAALPRDSEAAELVHQLRVAVPAGDYLVLGGDLNSGSRTESCIITLGQVVATGGPHPADQRGNTNTNASRIAPLDWVLASPALDAFKVPLAIGTSTYPNGLVLDSRVYTPLTDIAPVLKTDSGALNMQHMAVSKDFLIAR